MRFTVIPNFLEGTPEQEGDWKYRRQRRISRYGSVFKGRVAPGMKPGASPEATRKAHRSLTKIAKSAGSWSKRGSKGGAGGKIRHDPSYMQKLTHMYSKKK